MKTLNLTIIVFITVLLCFFILFLPFHNNNSYEIDIVEINKITKSCENNWDSPHLFKKDIYNYTVIDLKENIIFKTQNSSTYDVNSAIKAGNIIIDIFQNNTVVGKLLIQNPVYEKTEKLKNDLFTSSVICLFIIFALLLGYLFYINTRIIKPFKKLKNFSANIARGNFDYPLPMDRSNIFGAFTESFDIMREELLKSKEKELLANKSKKELIAQLSHDIKTPVSSIIAVSEIMLLKAKNEEEKTKIMTIIKKAEQINSLISNMFHATLEELQHLSVLTTEVKSVIIPELIQNSDYQNKVVIKNTAECIISCDPDRLQQVFDNIINNSYKYSETDISVSSEIVNDYLYITFKDYGKGIDEEDLLLIFEKFYRGKNSENKSGAGLGLYIAKYLMTQMNGDISIRNVSDGFEVFVKIPLI